jgi:hypothetical protein
MFVMAQFYAKIRPTTETAVVAGMPIKDNKYNRQLRRNIFFSQTMKWNHSGVALFGNGSSRRCLRETDFESVQIDLSWQRSNYENSRQGMMLFGPKTRPSMNLGVNPCRSGSHTGRKNIDIKAQVFDAVQGTDSL